MRVRLANPSVAARVRLGHPWIYRDALEAVPVARPGEVVEVVGRGGVVLGRGFLDPRGAIAVRLLAPGDAAVDDALVRGRVADACRLRRLVAIDSDAVRLVHGEGDFLPGLTIDRYGEVGVVRFDGAAAEAFWRPRFAVVAAACAAGGFPLARAWARPAEGRRAGGEALLGGPPGAIVIHEGAARYEVDVVRGQKTGFFLDQRDNRALVGGLAAGAEVLNLFAYTGGFSIAAALGGARRVTSVEVARPAAAALSANLARNGLAPAGHEVVVGDAFEFLERAVADGRRWDLVVCDPPSFAPSAAARGKGLAAYRRLNRLAAAVVSPGGLLATASCSSHVTEADLSAQVAAALGDSRLAGRVLAARGAAADHPVPPAFPEGRYLKLLLVLVTSWAAAGWSRRAPTSC